MSQQPYSRVGQPHIEPVVAQVQVPPGMLGPNPVSFEVRCFVVAGPGGVVLVDTIPGSAKEIGRAVANVGAEWSDVTDIVLTHRHFDHTGGLAETAELAIGATIWAGAEDVREILLQGGRAVRPLADGQQVGPLRVLRTPGHTPGHVTLLNEESSLLLIGDLVGSVDGALSFGPAAFMADPALNHRSLQRMVDLEPERILFSHGGEVPYPAEAIRQLLDRP